jgi:hypothetical protein
MLPDGRVGTGLGLAVGLGDGTMVGVEPPTSLVRGRKVKPMTATATTAAMVIAALLALFMSVNLRGGHQDRRCGVVGTWSSTASRTRSGSAVAPSSSHDLTMRVVSRSVCIS